MRIHPPEFLANLYRDLRDRRLLLPAGALLVALVAVPVLLSESPAPPPPPPQTDGIEATAASPAVLAEQPGIRNYRKRLAALKRKNPFEQQFAFPEPGSADITELGSGGGAGSGEPSGSGGGEPPSELHAAAPPGRPSGGSQRQSRPQGPRVKRLWWTWEVDLLFGPLGEARRYRNVKALDLLPSNSNPLVAFLGAGPNGRRATFLISDEVTSSEGDGVCAPNQATCYFVRLKPGEERRLTVAPEGEGPGVTYRLKLRRINEKIINRPRD